MYSTSSCNWWETKNVGLWWEMRDFRIGGIYKASNAWFTGEWSPSQKLQRFFFPTKVVGALTNRPKGIKDNSFHFEACLHRNFILVESCHHEFSKKFPRSNYAPLSAATRDYLFSFSFFKESHWLMTGRLDGVLVSMEELVITKIRAVYMYLIGRYIWV